MSSRPRNARVAVVVAAAVFATPLGVSAQVGVIEGLVKSVTDVNFYAQYSGLQGKQLKSEKSPGVFGLGFELALAIGAKESKARPAIPPLASCAARDQRGELSDGTKCADTVRTLRETETTSGNVVTKHDVTVTPYGRTHVDTLVLFELAVGYAQSGAYLGRDEVDLNTSVRELPSVTIYASFSYDILRTGVSPYLGARTGIVTLHSGRAYTDTVVYTLAGQTFELAPVAGIVRDVAGINVFLEGSYAWRRFPSVEWTAPKGGLPAGYPKSLNLSGWSVALGGQVEIRPHGGK